MKGMSILKKAEFKSVEDLPRTTVGFGSNTCKDLPPQLTQAQVAYKVKWWAKSPMACAQWARTPPHHPLSMQECLNLVDRKGLEISSTERMCKVNQEIRTLPDGMDRVDWTERNSREVSRCERQGDVTRQGFRRRNIKSRTQAEIRRKPSGLLP